MLDHQALTYQLNTRLYPLIASEIEKEAARVSPLGQGSHSARLETLRAEAEILGLAYRQARRELGELVARPRREHNSKVLINRLPDEMLAEIFKYGLTLRPEMYLAVIASVCGIWRQVATQTPTLWSRINYILREDSERLPSLGRIQLYLIRSKNVQLELNIQLYRDTTDGIVNFYNIITPHFPRCRLIDVTISHFDTTYLLFPIPGRLFALHELSVALIGVDDPQEDYDGIIGEHTLAPEIRLTDGLDYDLRSFTLKATPGYQVALDHIQRSKITHLEIFLSAADSLRLIAECPVIKTLIIGFMPCFENQSFDDLGQVDVPSLTSIHAHGLGIGMRMLCAISARNLRHLTLAPDEDGDNELDHVFSTEPSRFPRLTTLSIVHLLPTPENMDRFISAHPHLIALALVCEPGIDQILHLFMPIVPSPTSNATGPPQLRLIRLHWDYRVTIEDEVVAPALHALLERCEDVRVEWSSYHESHPAIQQVHASFLTRVDRVPPNIPRLEHMFLVRET